ncbi:MAG: 16S rRNA (cytosine(967)-C(5))-methyltransferase, partial [Gammaproteobacteria bacterium]|nr:16S rRNA (cytosine(967)-C(5))-methyltransferase [Gammaproteobacteria bacterium]
KLLHALWLLLRPGGILVYATCSILPQENTQQVMNFLEQQQDASEIQIDEDWGHYQTAGRQILPGEDEMDGFYYACLVKA